MTIPRIPLACLGMVLVACVAESPEPPASAPRRATVIQNDHHGGQGTSAQGRAAQGLVSRGIDPGLLKVMRTGATWGRCEVNDLRVEQGRLTGTLNQPGAELDGQPLPNDGVGTQLDVRSLDGTIQMTVKVESKRMDDNESSLMADAAHRTNDLDIHLYELKQFMTDTAEWVDFCRPHPDRIDDRRAIFNEGIWTRSTWITLKAERVVALYGRDPAAFGLSCWDGVAAKCARWGYKEWQTLTSPKTGESVQMSPFFIACQRAAMADYCGDGTSYTQEGTPVDIWDAHDFVRKENEDNPFPMYADESSFDTSRAVGVERQRYARLPPTCVKECTEPDKTAPIACFSRIDAFLERDTYSGSRKQLIFVDTGTREYCPHEATKTLSPPMPMHPTCNSCTRKICSDPELATCCSKAWSSACAQAAQTRCAMTP